MNLTAAVLNLPWRRIGRVAWGTSVFLLKISLIAVAFVASLFASNEEDPDNKANSDSGSDEPELNILAGQFAPGTNPHAGYGNPEWELKYGYFANREDD